MNIVSAKVSELADRLARLTGEDVETALEHAIEEKLLRVIDLTPTRDRRAALQKFFDHISKMPLRDARPIDEIIGYGPDGLPTR